MYSFAEFKNKGATVWYDQLESLNPETAWELAREKIETDFLGADQVKQKAGAKFMVVPDLQFAHLYQLGFCFVREFYNPQSTLLGLRNRRLMPNGPLEFHTVLGASDHFDKKMETSWDWPFCDYHRIVMNLSDETGLFKEVEVRIIKAYRVSQPALTTGDCSISSDGFAQLRMTARNYKMDLFPPPPRSFYVVHDTVRCKELIISLKIGEDQELYTWKDPIFGFQLTRYSVPIFDSQNPRSIVYFPTGIVNSWTAGFKSPTQIIWPTKEQYEDSSDLSILNVDLADSDEVRRHHADHRELPYGDIPEYVEVIAGSPEKPQSAPAGEIAAESKPTVIQDTTHPLPPTEQEKISTEIPPPIRPRRGRNPKKLSIKTFECSEF